MAHFITPVLIGQNKIQTPPSTWVKTRLEGTDKYSLTVLAKSGSPRKSNAGSKILSYPVVFLLLLPVLLWLTACKKDNSGPTKKDPCPWPEITAEGRNTFGCTINGNEWVPCVDLHGLAVSLRPIECTLRESDGSNFLSLVLTYSIQKTGSDTLESLIIGLKPLKLGYNGVRDLVYSKLDFGQIFESGQTSNNWGNIDLNSENYIDIIRLDTAQNIISGMFEFSLISESRQDTLHLRSGRFDVNYFAQ